MTAARTVYVALSALLVTAVLTVVVVLLSVPAEPLDRAAVLSVCQSEQDSADCYPARA